MKAAAAADDVIDRLVAELDRHDRLALAVSGGVDSMTLAHVAQRYARARATMYHAAGPAVPVAARGRVEAHAARHGWALVVLDAGEFADERYRANPVDRCYYCKSNLYARIRGLTADPIASGTNRDDLGDFRPGLRAAAEQGVVHPYVDAGIAKADVYALACRLGLPDLQRLPAQPCLASRVETGIAIAAADLAFIDAVETRLAAEFGGDAVVRCRVTHGGVVIEVGEANETAVADVARAIGADACRTARPGLRRRARVPPGGGVPARRGQWLSSSWTGRARRAPGRAKPCSASRRPWPRSAPSSTMRRLAAGGFSSRACPSASTAASPGPRAKGWTTTPPSRTAILGGLSAPRNRERVAIVCGGTSDAPVAFEAARTLAFEGEQATLVVDVGVAGLWRLMERIDEIRRHRVVIAIAGMEGALFSVIAGLVHCPVLAVPRSVGYGVGQGGRTALRAALASCASGLVVVNIDNGFGAAHAALRMLGTPAGVQTAPVVQDEPAQPPLAR